MRVGLVGDFDEIKLEFLRQGAGLGDRVDTRLGDVVPDQADLGNLDLTIDPQFVLIFFRTAGLVAVRLRSRRLRSVRRCDRAFLLLVKILILCLLGQFLPDGLLNVLHETLGRHRAHVGSSTSDRNGVLGLFFFADNHQDRSSMEARISELFSRFTTFFA